MEEAWGAGRGTLQADLRRTDLSPPRGTLGWSWGGDVDPTWRQEWELEGAPKRGDVERLLWTIGWGGSPESERSFIGFPAGQDGTCPPLSALGPPKCRLRLWEDGVAAGGP